MGKPQILGVVNLTEDSFSDGGLFLEPDKALAHALKLAREGADAIDLGPAASHPDSREVSPQEEIRRLDPVIEQLRANGIAVSVDSFRPDTQTWAARRGVAFLNDIQGFPERDMYSVLAESRCKLIVMHSVQGGGRATRVASDPDTIVAKVESFFTARVAALEAAGISRDRIIIDPGMGYFLGSNPEPSLVILRSIGRLKEHLGLPILICVSRKSFLRTLTGRRVEESGPATLAAELYAALAGADYIRTHDVKALSDALKVLAALE